MAVLKDNRNNMAMPKISVPKVSVLLPVRNASSYVAGCIRSVLDQTFDNLELIVVDDGSTDDSADVIKRAVGNDPRVQFLSRANMGMACTLNQMLEIAGGELIARLDADDAALLDRFAKQVHYLDTHPHCVVVGGGVINIDADGDPLSVELYPEHHEQIERRLLSGGGGIIHPSTMIRAEVLRACGGYAIDCPVVEDQELWLRMAMVGRLANLPEPLIRYRVHADNMSFTGASDAGKRLAEVLVRAHRDRSLPLPTMGNWMNVPLVDQWERRRQWAWSAIQSGYYATARKHARQLLQEKAFNRNAWILLAYAYFPRLAERLRRVFRRCR